MSRWMWGNLFEDTRQNLSLDAFQFSLGGLNQSNSSKLFSEDAIAVISKILAAAFGAEGFEVGKPLQLSLF
jgi:hypothetical protein